MKSARQLVDEALGEVRSLSVDEARVLLGRDDVVFVDLRERAELITEGAIPGAFHAPRGLLEFWVDPTSPWHQPALAPGKRLMLFCAAGWRSALAAKALQDMGRDDVCHLDDGFTAWKNAGAPVEPVVRRT